MIIFYMRLLIIFQGIHEIDYDVYLSLPASLGDNGIGDIVKQPLSEDEKDKLRLSASMMNEVLSGLEF